MEIEFTARIIPEEKREQLYASIAFALASILLCILIGLFILPLLGLLIGLGIALALVSFRPYLAYRAQERTPDKLQLTHQSLIFFTKGKKALAIPLKAIQKVEYKEGLVIYLKRPISERIEIIDAAQLRKTGQGDFFFAWFEPKIFALVQTELHNIVHADKPH